MTDTLNNRSTDSTADPEETNEWIESFDQLVASRGPDRAADILRTLQARAGTAGVATPARLVTDYVAIGVA